MVAQEACLGGELFDLILEKGHFTERDAAQIVSVVLRVIQHCHLQGVIHRGAQRSAHVKGVGWEGVVQWAVVRCAEQGVCACKGGNGWTCGGRRSCIWAGLRRCCEPPSPGTR